MALPIINRFIVKTGMRRIIDKLLVKKNPTGNLYRSGFKESRNKDQEVLTVISYSPIHIEKLATSLFGACMLVKKNEDDQEEVPKKIEPVRFKFPLTK